MSKNLLWCFAGVISTWLILGFFTKDFGLDFLIILLLGVFTGYSVGKREATD